VAKQWLRVKVQAGGAVGLAGADVFYFGNAIGEVGNSSIDAKVNTTDVSLARSNQMVFPNVPAITNKYDFNRDHKVNITDVSLARANQTTVLNALKLIAAPAEPPGLPVPDGSSGTPGVLGLAALPTGNGFAKPQAAAGTAAATGKTTSSGGLSATMDALASTVVSAPTPKLGAGLGTTLIDALAATALTRPL
jgi:hypothetical protein